MMKKNKPTTTEVRFNLAMLEQQCVMVRIEGYQLVIECPAGLLPSNLINEELLDKVCKEHNIGDAEQVSLIETFYNGLEDKSMMAILMRARDRANGF